MIRELRDSDIPILRDIYKRRGLSECFPDLNDPLFLTKVVMTDEQDVPRLAAAVRLEGNVYTFVDPDWGRPEWRWEGFQFLHEQACEIASRKGLDSITCQVPPTLERFGKRLMSLGWDKALWPTYGRKI